MAQKEVIIYTTPVCPFCKKLKAYLDENDIEYLEKDISMDKDAQGEVIEKTDKMIAPVIDIDGEIIEGFDRTLIEEALEEG